MTVDSLYTRCGCPLKHGGCSAMFIWCAKTAFNLFPVANVGHRNCQTMSNLLEQKSMRSNDLDLDIYIYDIRYVILYVYLRVEQKVHERGFLCVGLCACNE